MTEDFDGFCRRQWADFSYCLPEGESLGQVQRRNVDALETALRAGIRSKSEKIDVFALS